MFPALSPLRPQQKESSRFYPRDLATKVQKQSNSPILGLNLAANFNESSAILVYVLGSPPSPPPPIMAADKYIKRTLNDLYSHRSDDEVKNNGEGTPIGISMHQIESSLGHMVSQKIKITISTSVSVRMR